MSRIFLLLNRCRRNRDQAKNWQAIELIASTYGISPKTLSLILCKYSLYDEGVTRFIENQEASIPNHFNIRKSG